MTDLNVLLTNAMARITQQPGSVSALARLSGGANMESWAFDWHADGQTHALVLRRSPSPELMAGRSYGHATEAALIRIAVAAGVRAPFVFGELIASDALGSGYVMARVDAEVNPARIVADPAPQLIDDIARELARIHAIPTQNLPPLGAQSPEAMVADLRTRFADYGGDRPVMALALNWLAAHLPTPVAPVLLHGDFRIGNLMATPAGLAAVLDWELCHLGDRHQDLAFGCINSWRFGQIDRPAFGVSDFETFFAAYTRESGVAVDRARFRFWLVYSTLWWGLCCLQMAQIWRIGADASLERAVIGRRTSETEVDLLLLLEEEAPLAERGAIAAPASPIVRRWGEPSQSELLEALAGWLGDEIKPKAQGRDRFMVAVALNALGMLTRAEAGPDLIHDKGLADDLLEGRATLATPGLLARLKAGALAKLTADQPRYSALARARELWTHTEK